MAEGKIELLAELSNEVYELEQKITFLNENMEGSDTKELEAQRDIIVGELTKNIGKYDRYINILKAKYNALEAEKKEYEEVVERAKSGLKNYERTINFFEEFVLPRLVGKNNELESGTTRYKITETDGEIVIKDQSQVPSQFIVTVIDQKVDKAGLKKYIKGLKESPEYAYIKRRRYVKASARKWK